MTGPVFDAYLAVDWSARSAPSPLRPSPDSVWVAEFRRGLDADEVHTTYVRTRHDCHQWLRQRLIDHVARGRRVIVGFDFPFGYPKGFAAALGLGGLAPWRLIWDELDLLIEDAPDNSNNRFEVAAALNRRCARGRRHDQDQTLDSGSPATAPGPLWGCPQAVAGQWIQPTSPHYPYRARGLSLPRLRWAEQRVPGTQPAWKLMGIGSVGSQCLLGIPVVSRLRSDPRLRDVSRVWPFETRFTDSPGPAGGAFVLHAEIWPGIVYGRNAAADRGHEVPGHPGSARQEQPGMIKDEAQVRAVVRWLCSADGSGGLGELLAAPARLPTSAHDDILAEEGWILGG